MYCWNICVASFFGYDTGEWMKEWMKDLSVSKLLNELCEDSTHSYDSENTPCTGWRRQVTETDGNLSRPWCLASPAEVHTDVLELHSGCIGVPFLKHPKLHWWWEKVEPKMGWLCIINGSRCNGGCVHFSCNRILHLWSQKKRLMK